MKRRLYSVPHGRSVMISIYGTVYNNGYALQQSLDSLISTLNNVELDYEIVIVDNYSTDNTWKILEEYKKKMPHRFKIYRAKCSRGKGRDLALRRTSGEYVMYVDFDCLFSRRFGYMIKSILGIIKRDEIWNNGLTYRDTMINIVNGWSDLNMCEDYDMNIRAVLKGIKLKHVMIQKPYKNIRKTGKIVGEERYARNRFDKFLRVLRLRRDALLGCNLNCKYFAMMTDGFIPKIIGCSIIKAFKLIYRNRLKHSYLHRNNLLAFEFIYDKINLVPPETIGFDPHDLLYVFRMVNITHSSVINKVKQLYSNIKDIKIAVFNKNIIIYRDKEVLDNYLSYYSENYEPIKYFKIIK
ncbi:MAG: glycosyltransferase [Crenarchaeota archaeon]|nr:glycosyltransferase [Thermoproteota archaeon]